MELVYPFMIGVIFVGASAMRTLKMVDGKPLPVFVCSVVIGVTYYFMIRYAIGQNLADYISFSAGTVLITTLLAWRRRNERSR